MQCAKCGADNPVDAYFCGTCGVQLRSSFGSSGPVELGHSGSPEALSDDPAPGPPTNPFSEAEPRARAAYTSAFRPDETKPAPSELLPPPPPPPPPPPRPPQYDVHSPGAGLTAPPQAAPPPPVQGYGPGYAPPPVYTGHPGTYVPGGAGNTSGMGDSSLVPPEAKGWSWAGFVPFGLFAFMNGNTTWGIIGLLGSFIGLAGIVYTIYIGISGKELAWKNKRFNSVEEYLASMKSWNLAGLILLGVGVVFMILYFFVIAAMIAAGAMSEGMSGV